MKRHLLFVLAMLCVQCLVGQEASPVFYRQYATQQYMKGLMAAYPEMVETRSSIERFTYDFQRYGMPDTPYIPVVFHFIGNAAAEITPDDVQAQLSVLNAAFMLPEMPIGENLHPAWEMEGFKDKAARPSIGFCLAPQDPMGNPTTGILYVSSQASSFPVDATLTTSENGGTMGWEQKQYLNIYVASLADDVAGFAQMPGGPFDSDGIVINSSFFARTKPQSTLEANPKMESYVYGKTLAHLVGSYLNLYELWNDDQPCADDYVFDTPIHNAPNYDKPDYRHISTCGDNPVEMTMNLMDNTDDEAQYMFTNGQMMRMYATLAPSGVPREGLRQLGTQCASGFGLGELGDRSSSRDKASIPEKLAITVYPNPANNGFTVMINMPCEEELHLTAIDELGGQKHAQTIGNAMAGATNSIYISSKDWAPGLYVVRVQCGKETAVAKVLLER